MKTTQKWSAEDRQAIQDLLKVLAKQEQKLEGMLGMLNVMTAEMKLALGGCLYAQLVVDWHAQGQDGNPPRAPNLPEVDGGVTAP